MHRWERYGRLCERILMSCLFYSTRRVRTGDSIEIVFSALCISSISLSKVLCRWLRPSTMARRLRASLGQSERYSRPLPNRVTDRWKRATQRTAKNRLLNDRCCI